MEVEGGDIFVSVEDLDDDSDYVILTLSVYCANVTSNLSSELLMVALTVKSFIFQKMGGLSILLFA